MTDRGSADFIVSHTPDSPDFLVRNGRLYLETQRVSGALVLVTWVRQTDWPAARLKQFFAMHPELAGIQAAGGEGGDGGATTTGPPTKSQASRAPRE
jgi:hypothetical protein